MSAFSAETPGFELQTFWLQAWSFLVQFSGYWDEPRVSVRVDPMSE